MISREKPVLGVDIGGSKILAVLFSPGWQVLAREERATDVEEGVDAVIERVEATIADILSSAEIPPTSLAGIGIACAGGVDTQSGVIVTPSPNMADWEDIPLREIIAESFTTPVFLINDSSAAALGEHRFGAGRGRNNLVLLTLGTGIGGGIVIDGKLYLGARGAAAEIGHMTVADGPICGCGNYGCLELFASGTAVERDARMRLEGGEISVLRDMTGNRPRNITARLISKAAKEGDKLAGDALGKAAHYLGIGLVNVVNIFNPEIVIIGGGLGMVGERLIGPARKIVMERAFGISAQSVDIVAAELDNEAGVYGAAAYALDAITY